MEVHRRLAGLALFFVHYLGGCSVHRDRNSPEVPSPAQVAQHDQASARGESRLDGGWVVSWEDRGDKQPGPRAQGDSLIWTGELLAGVPCGRGAALALALQSMLTQLSGGMWRHPSLTASISLDGVLGVYRGIAHRVVKCGEADIWRPFVRLHLNFMATHGDRLNPGAAQILEAPWTYVRDVLAERLGLSPEPSHEAKETFEGLVADWAGAVKLAHITRIGSDACYRVHLGLMAYQTVEELGHQVGDGARDLFCGNTAGWELATTNRWCGRPGLEEFVGAYRENAWQYKHQRCQWEKPDGGDLWQPGADEVRGLADLFGL